MVFDPLCVPFLVSFDVSDTSSCVLFAGDDEPWKNESDRFKGDERKEANASETSLESPGKKNCRNE